MLNSTERELEEAIDKAFFCSDKKLRTTNNSTSMVSWEINIFKKT